MKTLFGRIGLPVLGMTLLAPAWGSLTQNVYAVRLPPARVVAANHVIPPKQLEPVPIPPGIVLASASPAQWVDLKDYTYAERDSLLPGLPGMMARVDTQIEELKAKRATATESIRTAEWDFALREMQRARTTLKLACDELVKAAPETWNQQRDRVGEAWERAQNTYSAVKSNTTM